MLTLKYRDEDGVQEDKFRTQNELDEFVDYNTQRVRDCHEEKFEVISVTGTEEVETSIEIQSKLGVAIKMDISLLLDYSSSLIKPQVQVIHLLTEVELPFTSDFDTMSKIAQDKINNLSEENKIIGSPGIYLIGWSQVKEYKI